LHCLSQSLAPDSMYTSAIQGRHALVHQLTSMDEAVEDQLKFLLTQTTKGSGDKAIGIVIQCSINESSHTYKVLQIVLEIWRPPILDAKIP
jgi:hypothetical protein